jgi:TadE-like protein
MAIRLKKRQYGQASIELAMSVLMFVTMMGLLIGLSIYLYINHVFLTAAREGARMAAIDTNFANGGTQATGIQDVQTWVINFVQSSSSFQLTNNNISVSGPNGSVIGDRTMTVNVSYQLQNPVQILTFINRLTGGSAEGLDTFTINDTATMRYEE